MKILFYLFFIILNYLMLFKFARQLRSKKYTVILLAVFFAIYIPAMIINKFFTQSELLSIIQKDLLFRTYVSIVITILLSFANRFFPFAIARSVAFHEKYNAANINRNPIRFLIKQQDKIILVTTLLWFAGAIQTLYAVWFLMD